MKVTSFEIEMNGCKVEISIHTVKKNLKIVQKFEVFGEKLLNFVKIIIMFLLKKMK